MCAVERRFCKRARKKKKELGAALKEPVEEVRARAKFRARWAARGVANFSHLFEVEQQQRKFSADAVRARELCTMAVAVY